MKKTLKIAALIMCFVIILALALSQSYIFINAGHICAGDGCSVCRRLHNAEAVVEKLSVITELVAVFGVLTVLLCRAAIVICRKSEYYTLVEQGVKLNN